MRWTINELSSELGGIPLGETELSVEKLCALDECDAGAISPLFRKRLLNDIDCLPGAVLADGALARLALERGVRAAVIHRTPALALARLIDLFHPPEDESGGIHETAVVHPKAEIDPTVRIGPHAVVEEGVIIGALSVIGAHAVICEGTVIGRGVQVGPGAVIGAPGFGFIPTENGPVKVRHVGRVILEDEVEIGANTCIDRATIGATRIGRSTKLDNLVQVGHNAKLGKNVLVAGQTGLAGSAVIGDDAMLGGQVGIADHLTIGKRARIAAKSGVVGDVKTGEVVAGYPALPHRRWLRAMAALSRKADRGPKPK